MRRWTGGYMSVDRTQAFRKNWNTIKKLVGVKMENEVNQKPAQESQLIRPQMAPPTPEQLRKAQEAVQKLLGASAIESALKGHAGGFEFIRKELGNLADFRNRLPNQESRIYVQADVLVQALEQLLIKSLTDYRNAVDKILKQKPETLN